MAPVFEILDSVYTQDRENFTPVVFKYIDALKSYIRGKSQTTFLEVYGGDAITASEKENKTSANRKRKRHDENENNAMVVLADRPRKKKKSGLSYPDTPYNPQFTVAVLKTSLDDLYSEAIKIRVQYKQKTLSFTTQGGNRHV